MDNLDGSDHYSKIVDEPAPSLLTIIIDTNPSAWSLLSSTLPFSTALAHLLVFINAHLACNNSNTICIIAAHPHRAEFLYPSPHPQEPPTQNGHKDTNNTDTANFYGPFHHIQTTLLHSLTRLLATTPTTTSPSVALSGALTLALTYTNRHLTASSSTTNPPGGANNTNPSYTSQEHPPSLHARILILSLSSSLSAQYIPLTNTIFACQRLAIPIDIARLTPPAPSTTSSSTTQNSTAAPPPPFLQQASDATSGTYIPITHPTGLLQYLMLAFLPDAPTRQKLHNAGEQGVDFRAACFCHRRVVSVGFVCSVCLSIFCEPPVADPGEGQGNGQGAGSGDSGGKSVICLTCSTALKTGNYGLNPVVVGRKKKKRRKDRLDNGDTAGAGGGTSGAATPVR